MADKDYQTVLIEQFVDQNKAILEFVGEMPGIKKDIAELKEDVAKLKSDMKVVKVMSNTCWEFGGADSRLAGWPAKRA
jgi:hypothetical protein